MSPAVSAGIQTAARWLQQSDGIVLCAANGLSMSEGFAILRPSDWFSRQFGDFVQNYGFLTPLQGLQYPFADPAEFSKFYQRFIRAIHYDKPISPIMKKLHSLAMIHPCFVLTTNIEDRFVQAGFPESEVFYLEGRLTHRKDHFRLQENDLNEIRSASQLEVDDYPNSPHFQQKLQQLRQFLALHPRFLILELGVSPNNGFLRPLISQMLQACPQSRLAAFNLTLNPYLEKDPQRIVQITGDLETNLEQLDILLSQTKGATPLSAGGSDKTI